MKILERIFGVVDSGDNRREGITVRQLGRGIRMNIFFWGFLFSFWGYMEGNVEYFWQYLEGNVGLGGDFCLFAFAKMEL